MSTRTLEPARLTVHTCRTHLEDGQVRESHAVDCPRRGRSLTANECFHCEHLIGVSLGPDKLHYELSCFVDDQVVHPATVWAETPISEIMTREVQCVEPAVAVDTVTDLLLEGGMSGMPVVDGEGHPLGVVSKTDLLRESREARRMPAVESQETSAAKTERANTPRSEPRAPRIVADVMTTIDFSLHETATVAEAAALMAYEGVHRIPVLSGTGVVVGIVSSMDVMRFIGSTSGYLR